MFVNMKYAGVHAFKNANTAEPITQCIMFHRIENPKPYGFNANMVASDGTILVSVPVILMDDDLDTPIFRLNGKSKVSTPMNLAKKDGAVEIGDNKFLHIDLSNKDHVLIGDDAYERPNKETADKYIKFAQSYTEWMVFHDVFGSDNEPYIHFVAGVEYMKVASMLGVDMWFCPLFKRSDWGPTPVFITPLRSNDGEDLVAFDASPFKTPHPFAIYMPKEKLKKFEKKLYEKIPYWWPR